MAAATSSLPVPLSPSMSTGESVTATLAMMSLTPCIGPEEPTISLTVSSSPEPGSKRVDLAPEEAALHHPRHEMAQLVQDQRLGEIVVGALLERLDG